MRKLVLILACVGLSAAAANAATLRLYFSASNSLDEVPLEFFYEINATVAMGQPAYLWAHVEPGDIWERLNLLFAGTAGGVVSGEMYNPDRWLAPMSDLDPVGDNHVDCWAWYDMSGGMGLGDPWDEMSFGDHYLVGEVTFSQTGEVFLLIMPLGIQRWGGDPWDEVYFGFGDDPLLCMDIGETSDLPDLYVAGEGGACCFNDGSCTVTLDEVQCLDMGGVDWISGEGCDPNPCQLENVFYVDDDAPPGGDGLTWSTAFNDLQDALSASAAGSGSAIRVAGGTYKPDHGTGDRLTGFQLENGVAIYGGYAGLSNPEGPDVRDLELYPSVLNGDLLDDDDLGGDCAVEWSSDCCFSHPGEGCDDADCESTICYEEVWECVEWDPETGECIMMMPFPPVGEWCCEGEEWDPDCAALAREYCGVCSGVSTSTGPDCDNSCHVVTGSGADATAILDGFVITAGNADAFDANAGGGLYNDGGNPTITDCVFTGNSAEYGGGMGNYGASPTVTNCTFTENTAVIGGGMDSEGGNPTITDCMFTGNSADYNGGGMSNDDASPTLTNCTFTQNAAESSSGGGMVNAGSGASPTLINCTFTQNAADETGGAVFNVSYSNPTLVDCLISENSAGVRGGGMENRQYGAPTLINCRLINNLSDGIYFANSASGTLTDCAFIGNSGRGAICYAGSSPTLLNCIFTGNSGGGMSCLGYEGTNPTLINCTFSGNSGSPGGAIYCGGYSGPALTNCVLWNGIDGVWCEADATPTITYSDVQGGWEGTGNIDADPLFVPGPLGPYYLSQTAAGDPLQSPCSDAGDAASPLVDGTTRCDEVLDTGIVDMGYHYPVSGLPLIMGDFDYDGDVDLGDFAGFEDCLGGSDQVIVSPPCRVFDFDADGDVDLGDFASFQVAFAGA